VESLQDHCCKNEENRCKHFFQTIKLNTYVGRAVRLFRCNMNGSPAIIRLCRYIVHFIIKIIIGAATRRARGLQPPVKDRDTLIEQSVTLINEAQVVYDKFMKQIRTVRYSFNTTSTANYRVQLAVPPSIKNYHHNHNDTVFKKVIKQVATLLKKLGIFN